MDEIKKVSNFDTENFKKKWLLDWRYQSDDVNRLLNKNQFIKQCWRTSEFAVDAEDSILELSFKEKNGKTTLELYHYHLQPGDGKKYLDGWKEFYFEPMRSYFNKVS